jgi:GNAT superfamily N-acetyltransferase
MKLEIKDILADNLADALDLAWEVFLQFEAPEYPAEGVKEFYNSIHNPSYLSQLEVFAAYDGNEMAGVIATRNQGSHIALFFVKSEYQGKGIGRQLFDVVAHRCPANAMTVFSSPYAVPIYHKLGFLDTDTEKTTNGIRYTPMEIVPSNK